MSDYGDRMHRHRILSRIVTWSLILGLWFYNARVFAHTWHRIRATYYAAVTTLELQEMSGQLIQHWAGTNPLPRSQREFEGFIKQEFAGSGGHRDPTLDRFGHHLVFTPEMHQGRAIGYTITSPGADGRLGTEDDLSVHWSKPTAPPL